MGGRGGPGGGLTVVIGINRFKGSPNPGNLNPNWGYGGSPRGEGLQDEIRGAQTFYKYGFLERKNTILYN